MDILCPNCKQKADLHEIGEVKHIECPDCGWFKVQADSTFVACDEPPGPEQTKPATPTEPAMPEPAELAHGKGPASTSEAIPTEVETPSSLVASDKPDIDNEDDLDEFEEDWGNVSITFED